MNSMARVAFLVLVVLLAACTGSEGVDPGLSPSPTDPAPAISLPIPLEATEQSPAPETVEPLPDPSNLVSSNELVSNCLNYPAEEITSTSAVRLTMGVTVGEPAVDFSLMSSDGSIHSLSDLLRTKPILIVLGGFT